MADLKLQCQCGAVKGKVTDVSPKTGNRIICYCKDCRAFASHLDKAEQALDEAGGSEIYQIPPAKFQIDTGKEHVALLRLTPKGLNRWYCKCCNTPIGNTVGPELPFIGLVHTFIAEGQNTDQLIGAATGNVNTSGATQDIPESSYKHRGELSVVLQIMRKLMWWKITGQGSPNLLFENKRPIAKPEILSGS